MFTFDYGFNSLVIHHMCLFYRRGFVLGMNPFKRDVHKESREYHYPASARAVYSTQNAINSDYY